MPLEDGIGKTHFHLIQRFYIFEIVMQNTDSISKGGICIPNSTTGDLTVNDIDLFQRSNVTA